MGMKTTITAIEAHNGLTGIIAEKTKVLENGKAHQFDAMWISSLMSFQDIIRLIPEE